jgi:nicotinamide riboside kinase
LCSIQKSIKSNTKLELTKKIKYAERQTYLDGAKGNFDNLFCRFFFLGCPQNRLAKIHATIADSVFDSNALYRLQKFSKRRMKKIVIIGPESTGKSTLCEKLAAHYKTVWVKEYARDYLLQNGTEYTFENLLDVAKGQINNETQGQLQLATQPTTSLPLIIDTDMIVLKVWCEFVFDKCHPWILNQIVERQYDLYLLCNIDVPWVKDTLREYPDLVIREKLYHHYKDIMVNQPTPWIDISGSYEVRLQKAIAAIDKIL